MSARVLVFVEDPGAANYILPILPELRAQGHGIELRACGSARAYITQRLDPAPREPEGDAATLLKAIKPTLVLVGTSENQDSIGLSLIDQCRKNGIATIGVVDIAANADQRFRGRSAEPLAFAPDFIFTSDEQTRSAFITLGHPPERVIATGHPHYDLVRARRGQLDIEGRTAVRQRCIPNAKPTQSVAVFIAEISTGLNPAQYHKSPEYSLHGRGRSILRTEIVIEEFLDAAALITPKPYLVLRLHPKNTRQEFAIYSSAFDEISEGGTPLDLVYAADAVVGMSSMLLYEAALMERPTLAILPRESERAWLPGGAEGVVAVATKRAEVQRCLNELILNRSQRASQPHGSAKPAAQTAADAVAQVLAHQTFNSGA